MTLFNLGSDAGKSVVGQTVVVLAINKIQQDATVCRYLFTASFTVHVSGVHRARHQEYKKTLNATSGTGHIT